MARYERFAAHPWGKASAAGGSRAALKDVRAFEMPAFSSGRKLRDYQDFGVRWMVSNFMAHTSCILGDEVCVCVYVGGGGA